MRVKKGDKVMVIAGKDKGKSGTILRALPKENKVIVEGMNIRKKHEKPARGNEKGKIVERSLPIHVSNVKVVK
jgi:large subunit ribosomal protein L24